jgi:hypothetical protein
VGRLAVAAEHEEQRVIRFFAQVLLLIVVGRLLSELIQCIGQPAVMGQLLAGIILGPSVFGAIWLAAQQTIFPLNSSDRQLLNAVSELGVLLLLLLTGMETDLALVKCMRLSAAITSAAGIVIPFTFGARRDAARQRSDRSTSALARFALPRDSAVHFLCQNRGCCGARGGFSSSQVDPYPFSFLTLVVSLQAIFLSTFILISDIGFFASAFKFQSEHLKRDKQLLRRLGSCVCAIVGKSTTY